MRAPHPRAAPVRAAAAPLPAAVAGRWVLLERIGIGGMGTVHRAWDLRDRREVAAKVLARGDPALLARFVREQSVRVRHPHVLAPLGWAADDDVAVLITPLVRGGSLDRVLAQGPLPSRWVAVLLGQLLEALTAVHATGVVHRDVKPANVLLVPTGTGRPHVLLGDFGIATAVYDDPDAARAARLTRVPGVVGTDGYLAPEALAGADPDPRQDLWAAGRLALRALGSRPPGALAPVLAALVADDPAERPASASGALVLLRCHVEPAPDWDPTGMPDIADVLGEVGGGRATRRRGRAPLLRRAGSACLVAGSALSGAGALVSVVAR